MDIVKLEKLIPSSILDAFSEVLTSIDSKRKVTLLTSLALAVVYGGFKVVTSASRRNEKQFKMIPGAHWFYGHSKILQNTKEQFGKIFMQELTKMNESVARFSPHSLVGGTCLFVGQLETFKEVFQTNGAKSSLRIVKNRLHTDYSQKKGILQTDGPVWTSNRRIYHAYIRKFDRNSQVEISKVEAKFLLEALGDLGQTEPSRLLSLASANVISNFIFGERFDYTDEDYNQILDTIRSGNNRNYEHVPPLLWRFLRFTGISSGFNKRLQDMIQSENFIKSKVIEVLNRDTSGSEKQSETLIDSFARETRNDGSEMNFDNLLAVIHELLIAGTDTTSATMQWCFTLLAYKPEIQERAAAEVQRVLGIDSLQFDHFEKMPFVMAVQQEILRFGCIGGNTLPHKTSEKIHLNSGHTIQKGTILLGGIYSVMRDPTRFKYPDDFNPENFLNESGELVNNEAFVPFGMGPRICLGQQLADLELKVFIVECLRRFVISCEEEIDINEIEQKISVSPKARVFKFTPRV